MEDLKKKLQEKMDAKKQILENIKAAEAGQLDLQNKINQWMIDGAEIQGQVKLLEEMIAGENTKNNPEKSESEAK